MLAKIVEKKYINMIEEVVVLENSIKAGDVNSIDFLKKNIRCQFAFQEYFDVTDNLILYDIIDEHTLLLARVDHPCIDVPLMSLDDLEVAFENIDHIRLAKVSGPPANT